MVLALAASAVQPAETAAVDEAAVRATVREMLADLDTRVDVDADRLDRLLDEHYQQMLAGDPVGASIRGDDRYGALLRDESPAAYAQRAVARAARLERLLKIDTKLLSDADQLNYGLLKWELEMATAGERFHAEQMAIDNQEGPAISLPQMSDRLALVTDKQLGDYVARLEAIPTLLDQCTEQLMAGMAAKRVPPKTAVAHVAEQALGQGKPELAADPARSVFYRPLAGRPGGDALADRAKKAIATGVVPAFKKFGVFLRDSYVPACRESFGASEGVDGIAYYEYRLRRETTTKMSAEDVHQLGLREVARIRAEMFRVIARTDFARKDELKGDELFKAFTDYLRTDKRFYCTEPEELLRGYREIAKRIDPELARLFGKLPRNPYGVREIPRFVAISSPTAYYYEGSIAAGLPGYFMANTYRLDQRPRYEMTSLTLHEAMPGHHLQIALAQELEGVHPFRRMLGYTVFVEGWGLYAERLGLDMEGPILKPGEDELGRGLYKDPYTDFGRLTYEMWRATRLVVDTGLHAKQWSRQQAMDFMLANTALSALNIEREVDRYIAWPGQACAYKIGELKIRELRERAQKRLGDRFSIRAFHDAVLDAGALPLDVVEARVNRWIEKCAEGSR